MSVYRCKPNSRFLALHCSLNVLTLTRIFDSWHTCCLESAIEGSLRVQNQRVRRWMCFHHPSPLGRSISQYSASARRLPLLLPCSTPAASRTVFNPTPEQGTSSHVMFVNAQNSISPVCSTSNPSPCSFFARILSVCFLSLVSRRSKAWTSSADTFRKGSGM